jgi:hypothetical protein
LAPSLEVAKIVDRISRRAQRNRIRPGWRITAQSITLPPNESRDACEISPLSQLTHQFDYGILSVAADAKVRT